MNVTGDNATEPESADSAGNAIDGSLHEAHEPTRQHWQKRVPSCQVPDCKADLAGAKAYYRKYRICELHSRIDSIEFQGIQQRFCQLCGRFHDVNNFNGKQRTCRSQLDKHNARRRKKHSGSDDKWPLDDVLDPITGAKRQKVDDGAFADLSRVNDMLTQCWLMQQANATPHSGSFVILDNAQLEKLVQSYTPGAPGMPIPAQFLDPSQAFDPAAALVNNDQRLQQDMAQLAGINAALQQPMLAGKQLDVAAMQQLFASAAQLPASDASGLLAASTSMQLPMVDMMRMAALTPDATQLAADSSTQMQQLAAASLMMQPAADSTPPSSDSIIQQRKTVLHAALRLIDASVRLFQCLPHALPEPVRNQLVDTLAVQPSADSLLHAASAAELQHGLQGGHLPLAFDSAQLAHYVNSMPTASACGSAGVHPTQVSVAFTSAAPSAAELVVPQPDNTSLHSIAQQQQQLAAQMAGLQGAKGFGDHLGTLQPAANQHLQGPAGAGLGTGFQGPGLSPGDSIMGLQTAAGAQVGAGGVGVASMAGDVDLAGVIAADIGVDSGADVDVVDRVLNI